MGVGTDTLNRFEEAVACEKPGGLRSLGLETIQVNMGLRCNQYRSHCHVEASPHPTESMDWPAMETVARIARQAGCRLVDITG